MLASLFQILSERVTVDVRCVCLLLCSIALNCWGGFENCGLASWLFLFVLGRGFSWIVRTP
jgi:hypothetical protein